MTMAFRLPVPPSTNRLSRVSVNRVTGKARVYRAGTYARWKTTAGLMVNAQKAKAGLRWPFAGAVAVQISVPLTGLDLDNYAKAILDLLQYSEIVVNDRQVKWLLMDRESADKATVTVRVAPFARAPKIALGQAGAVVVADAV